MNYPQPTLCIGILTMNEARRIEQCIQSAKFAKQIVVVGDQKQLPPTSFFDRLADNSETDDSNDEDVSVVVTEANCSEDSCSPLETLIAVMRDPPMTIHIDKAISQVTAEDVRSALP